MHRLVSPDRNRKCLRSTLTLLLAILVTECAIGKAQTLPLPPRPANSPSGAAFAQSISGLSLPEREKEILLQVKAGNIPNFQRRFCPVLVTNVADGRTNLATFFVAPDYFAIGSDEDYFLMPLSPNTAQQIADAFKCSLPTPKMVDAIYAAAEVKLPPAPIPPSPAMTTVAVFSNHSALLRSQRERDLQTHPLGALVAGHKKDVVISVRLENAPGKAAIYGWHQTNGTPIQPLYLGHTADWVDYSHGIRLVQQKMLLNGKETTVSDVLADPLLASLLSGEGVIPRSRYVTNASNASSFAESASSRHSTLDTRSTNRFGERISIFTLDPDVRILINSPQENPATEKKVLLVLYALPNGNTIEQTVGRTSKPGDDWHYDIQHIGAQTRFVRELLPDRFIVVAYIENKLKSWPAWRKAHGNEPIPGIISAVKNAFHESVLATALPRISPLPFGRGEGRGEAAASTDLEIVLSGHSGGGSFIFGFLNAVERIPNEIIRIAFLDSTYAYDRGVRHNEKLARWLEEDDRHFLCVLAYDDANALLDGKSFVTATGGTWGRSHAMQTDLAQSFAFTSATNAGLQNFSALNGRIQFLLKENPERKVLHTVQVERNGFIHTIVSGTTNESKGYEYFGLRAYSRWIE